MLRYFDISLTCILTLILTIAMLWPQHHAPPAPDGSDKIVHLIAFASLALPLSLTNRFGLLPIFVGASTIGACIELIQPNFNRSADLADWFVDVVGVLLGIGGGLLYRRLRL